MKRNSNYHTKQKEIILSYIKNSTTEFTIKDIHNSLNNKVGLTTIYRLIQELDKKGLLIKKIGNDGTTYYSYLEKCNHDNHFLLQCDVCHHIIHIDCDCINGLTTHIKNSHHFKPSKDQIIINGICQDCNKNIKEVTV